MTYRLLCACEKKKLLAGEIENIICFLYNEEGDKLVDNYFNPISWISPEDLRRCTLSAVLDVTVPLEFVVNKEINRGRVTFSQF